MSFCTSKNGQYLWLSDSKLMLLYVFNDSHHLFIPRKKKSCQSPAQHKFIHWFLAYLHFKRIVDRFETDFIALIRYTLWMWIFLLFVNYKLLALKEMRGEWVKNLNILNEKAIYYWCVLLTQKRVQVSNTRFWLVFQQL